MKIEALRVTAVGQFTDGVSIENFSGKLDVLAGPNELGKSTLFRALRTVLTVGYGSTSAALLDPMTPYGGGSPTIELIFAAGGQRYRLRKQYRGGARAELETLNSGRATLVNRDAENALDQILVRTDDTVARGLLFVDQGAVSGPAFEKQLMVGTSDIRALVGHAASSALADPLLESILAQVDEALAMQVTDKGLKPRKNGPLWRAEEALRAAESHLGAMRLQNNLLLERLALLATLRAELAQANDPTTVEALSATLKTAEDRLAATLEAEQRLRELTPTAALEADRATAAIDVRDRYEALLTVDERGAAKLAALQQQQVTAVAAADAARIALREAETTLASSEAARSVAHARQQATHRYYVGLERDRLAALRDTVLDVSAQRAQAVEAHAQIQVTVGALEVLRRTDQTLHATETAHQARLQALAIDVVVMPEPGATQTFTILGRPIKATEALSISTPLEIEAAGIGRIRIVPANAMGRDTEDALVAARMATASQLAALSVVSLEAAEKLGAARQAFGEEVATLTAKLSVLAPDGIQRIEAALIAKSTELARLATDEAVDALAVIETDRAAVDRAVAHTATAALEAQQSRNIWLLDMARAEAALRQVEHALAQERTAAQTRAALLGAPDSRSATRERHAGLAHALTHTANEARRTFDAWQQKLQAQGDGTVHRLARDAAETAIKSHASRRALLREKISELDGAVAALAVTDPRADLEDAETALMQAQLETRRLQRDVAALRLIRATADELAHRQRDLVLEPLLTSIGGGLAALFGAPGTLRLDHGFVPTAFERARGEEPLQRLSYGTQEQVALLVRCGLAELTADQGRPFPLVLDDALVHADEKRWAVIVAELARRSAKHQVIVFSCRDDATFATHGHRLELMPWRRV